MLVAIVLSILAMSTAQAQKLTGAGARRMKRSPGQGRLWAATTGPAGQTIASWSSRQLGRFAGAIGSRAAAAGSSSRRVHPAASITTEGLPPLRAAQDSP